MKIKDVVNALEMFAPLPLQDSYDNAGLQCGLTDAETTGALLCLDVTEAVVDEAVALGANLIVSHHPLIFRGIKSVTGKSYVERCLMKALKHDIVIYSMHTNLDNAPDGVNYKIAEKLGLQRVRILQPKEHCLLKLVTFVPTAYAESVREALFAAGCGCIGAYDKCSYNLSGHGTFRAGDGTNPFCGRQGELHTEEEVRVETVLPSFIQGKVMSALIAAHPYEEPAFDFYPLANDWTQAGGGVVGELPVPEAETGFLLRVKRLFDVGCVRHSKLTGKPVRRVALCGGAGAFLMPDAVRAGADAFITGEVKYHDWFSCPDSLLAAEIGHYESEQYTREIFYSIIREKCPSVLMYMTSVNTNPINYL